MKTVAAFTLALFVTTQATAAPLAMKAPNTGQTSSYIVHIGGEEAEAIKAKYKAKFEQLKAEMKAEMQALRQKKQAQMQQRKADKPPKAAKAQKPQKAEKQS